MEGCDRQCDGDSWLWAHEERVMDALSPGRGGGNVDVKATGREVSEWRGLSWKVRKLLC